MPIFMTIVKPKWYCDAEMEVKFHQEDYEMTCPVVADPPVDKMVVFYIPPGNKNVSMHAGDTEGPYHTSINAIVSCNL